MITPRGLSRTFTNFFDSEKASGILLIACTIVSLLLANSVLRARYLGFWHTYLGGLSIEHRQARKYWFISFRQTRWYSLQLS